MNGPVQFETPENVQISYQAAGPGTRFVAWFVDTILIFLLLVCIGILLACSGAALNVVFQDLADRLDPEADRDTSELPFYVFGMIWLLVGLGNLVYFGLSELILRGQTIGKRQVGIRVVKADGFALDAGSILVRSVFRVIDHFPLFWIVPLVSARGQRFGDMAAGRW